MRDTSHFDESSWARLPKPSVSAARKKRILKRITGGLRVASHNKIDYQFCPFPSKALRLIEQGKLKAIDAIVLLVLIDNWNPKTRSCWVTESRFMTATGVKIRALQASWKRLADAGLVDTIHVKKPEPWCPENTTGRRFYLLFSEPDGIAPDPQKR